ncbi:hypothetical protein Droror1_Dr00009164 [Drosera rotundifolia]
MYTTNTALHFMIWPCHSKMVRNSQLAKVTICAESAGSKKGNCLSAMDVLGFIKLAMVKSSFILLYVLLCATKFFLERVLMKFIYFVFPNLDVVDLVVSNFS